MLASNVRRERSWRTIVNTLLLAAICQIPSLRSWARLVPSAPVAAWLVWTGLSMSGYVWLLDRRPFSKKNSWPCAAVVAISLAIVAWFTYSEVDALRAIGRGSDADDSVLQVARSVVAGRDPYEEPTYLGNTITQGVAWSMLWWPVVSAGVVALAVPFWIVASALILDWATAARGQRAAEALAVAVSSPVLWEGVMTGSDPVAVGAAMSIVIVLAHRFASHTLGAAAVGIASGVVGTSRAAFASLPLLVAAFVWPRSRSSAALIASFGLSITLGEYAVRAALGGARGPEGEWLLAAQMLGATGLATVAASWIVAVMLIVRKRPQTLASWLAATAMTYAPSLFGFSWAYLVQNGFDVANWYGASVLLPLLLPVAASILVQDRSAIHSSGSRGSSS